MGHELETILHFIPLRYITLRNRNFGTYKDKSISPLCGIFKDLRVLVICMDENRTEAHGVRPKNEQVSTQFTVRYQYIPSLPLARTRGDGSKT